MVFYFIFFWLNKFKTKFIENLNIHQSKEIKDFTNNQTMLKLFEK